jgi:hypothetical protein
VTIIGSIVPKIGPEITVALLQLYSAWDVIYDKNHAEKPYVFLGYPIPPADERRPHVARGESVDEAIRLGAEKTILARVTA